MNQEEKTPMSNQNYAETFRRTLDRVHHEDTLIGHRFTWLLTTQTIFLSAYEIGQKLPLIEPNSPPNGTPETMSVINLIPWVALFICFLNYSSLLAALLAIYDFCRQLDKQFSQYVSFSKQNILGSTWTHIGGQASVFFMPLGFICLWIFIISQNLSVSLFVLFALLIILIIIWQWTFPYKSRLIIHRRRGR